jgi:heterodisulfide reductase subunit A
MTRIGVFVCSCGLNIARTVDIEEVVRVMGDYPGVVHAINYKYMCSDPGQSTIKDAIRDENLDGVVVASCSPALHEVTFRRTCESAGLNPYMCEIANIREQCSWVHNDREKATQKAGETIATVVEKVRFNEALVPISVPVTRRALVIGAGISGIQAALSIANSGHEVTLLEREPSIGGHLAGLAETYVTHDCSPCLLSSRIVEVKRHPRIETLTCSEIEDLKGYVGNFTAKIKTKASLVDPVRCDGCGLCVEKCPVAVAPQTERTPGKTKAIWIPSPQVVPAEAVIDRDICTHFQDGCDLCKKVCPRDAIDFDQGDRSMEKEVGAVVVATGFGLYPKEKIGEYGHGKYRDVIDGLEFERLLSVWERQGREIRRPSDGKVPREVVFIQCAGSRDPEHGMPYCSKVCCMYTAKHARMYKQAVPDGQAYVFYIDVRAGGKGYEEYVNESTKDEGTLYLRGKVARVFEDNGKIMVWGVDTLLGKKIEIAADLVVLATAMVPSEGAKDLAMRLKISSDQYGFFSEIHPKMRPVESPTSGVYLAGCAQAPRDIPETVAHASAAASKVAALFSRDKLSHEPIVVNVDEDICTGCAICVEACPYGAREIDEWKRIASVREVLCQGCGACAAACPNGATGQKNFTASQVLSMIDVAI